MQTYRLENEAVLVEFLDLGGIITKLVKKSTATNYVLAYEAQRYYEENPYFLGATIGRVAGRTSPPCYQNYRGEEVKLDINEGSLHLHGGKAGYHTKKWQVKKTDESAYTLTYFDYDSAYEPMCFRLVYRLEGMQFSMTYVGKAEVPTPCSLTNHSYFNLNPDKRLGIQKHFLKMAPAKLQRINEAFVPTVGDDEMTGENRAFDFKKTKKIEKAFELGTSLSKICAGGIDLAYVFEKEGDEAKVHLMSEHGENELKIYSNQEACVVYTLNKIEEEVRLTEGQPIQKYGGITFEMERRPNFVHEAEAYLAKDYFAITRYEII